MPVFLITLGEMQLDFSAITSDSLLMALIGYTVVFLALISLYLVFKNLPKLLNFVLRRKQKKQGVEKTIQAHEKEISGEVNAAIGMALYLYFNELHDTEKTVLTMKKVSKRYSPWNSKIYNVTNLRS